MKIATNTVGPGYLWIYLLTEKEVNEMGTTSDRAVLTRKLGAADYDPVRYVAEISQRCVGRYLHTCVIIFLKVEYGRY